VDAQVAGTVSTGGAVYVVIDDTSGVLQADKVQIAQLSSTSYMAQMLTSTTLAAGENKGSISVKVCSDLSCTTIYGQTSIPYDFTVDSSTNTTGISTLPGVADWETARGSASQTSYVPLTLDSSTFTVRWLQVNMGFEMAISPSGVLYVATSVAYSFQSGGYIPSAQALMAINLH
jgi:hypothetical protein